MLRLTRAMMFGIGSACLCIRFICRRHQASNLIRAAPAGTIARLWLSGSIVARPSCFPSLLDRAKLEQMRFAIMLRSNSANTLSCPTPPCLPASWCRGLLMEE
jgi:hypothetical protein